MARGPGASSEYASFLLVGGGFGGGMHAVLRDFVNAARGGLYALAVEMIERDTAFSDRISFFNRLHDVGFR